MSRPKIAWGREQIYPAVRPTGVEAKPVRFLGVPDQVMKKLADHKAN